MNKKIVTIVAIVSLVAVMACMFAGCADVYQKNLENAGCEVVKIDKADFEKEHKTVAAIMSDLSLKYIVSGTNVSEGISVTVVSVKEALTDDQVKLFDIIGEVSSDKKTVFIGNEKSIKAAKTGIVDKK